MTSCVKMANKGGSKHAPIPNRAVEESSVIPACLLRRNDLACIVPVSATVSLRCYFICRICVWPIYQTRDTVFHRISNTEKRGENTRRSGVFLMNFEVFDVIYQTRESVFHQIS